MSDRWTRLNEFVELDIFTRQIEQIGDPSLLETIEDELTKNPSAGSLIKGGVRKARVGARSRAGGKRGGYRVYYFFVDARGTIFLIWLLDKREADSVSPKEEEWMQALVKLIPK